MQWISAACSGACLLNADEANPYIFLPDMSTSKDAGTELYLPDYPDGWYLRNVLASHVSWEETRRVLFSPRQLQDLSRI
ncbi:hypothetical protein OH77DRAFT_256376 [Trametes cingulata]|nr:hypothetical protein OH77DRAFT_256376 [Trametes cingulata]